MMPGDMPMAVPNKQSRRRMRDAPTTRLTSVNGATGTSLSATIASTPCWPTRWLSRFRRRPPKRCTALRPSRRPTV
ncbi:hypothetical protein AWV80_04890 [Cupriavidus sp. UYMU48A]|nr:hypothetical protein AWV80_04890 [Cupriavidus sp. UYMU48A]